MGTRREIDESDSSHPFSLLRAAQSVAKTIADIVTSPAKNKKTEVDTETPNHTFELIPSRNGEEDERNVFCAHACLYVIDGDIWKTVGCGRVRINVDRKGKARLIMRRDITLGLLLNAKLDSDMKSKMMSRNAVAFSCKVSDPDVQYPNCEILALRFNADDHGMVDSFITAIDLHKNARA